MGSTSDDKKYWWVTVYSIWPAKSQIFKTGFTDPSWNFMVLWSIPTVDPGSNFFKSSLDKILCKKYMCQNTVPDNATRLSLTLVCLDSVSRFCGNSFDFFFFHYIWTIFRGRWDLYPSKLLAVVSQGMDKRGFPNPSIAQHDNFHDLPFFASFLKFLKIWPYVILWYELRRDFLFQNMCSFKRGEIVTNE